MNKMTRQKLRELLSRKFITYSKQAIDDLADSLWFRIHGVPSAHNEQAWHQFVANLRGEVVNQFERGLLKVEEV